MANIDKDIVQDAIKVSQKYNRLSLVQLLQKYYTGIDTGNIVIDEASAEGIELKKIATDTLRIEELQRSVSILEKGIQKNLRLLQRGIELDQSLGNIRQVIGGKIDLLENEFQTKPFAIGSPRHKALNALIDVHNLLDGLSGEDIFKYQLFIGAERYGLIGPDNLFAPPKETDFILQSPNTFQVISGKVDEYTGGYIDLENISEFITFVLPYVDTYQRFDTAQVKGHDPDAKIDVNENSVSVINLALELARLPLTEYDNENTILPLIDKLTYASTDFLVVQDYISKIGTQDKTEAIGIDKIAGLKSTFLWSPLDRLEDLMSADEYNSIGKIGEQVLAIQEDTTKGNFDPKVVKEISTVGLSLGFDSMSSIQPDQVATTFSEMRNGVDGWSLSGKDKSGFINMMQPLYKANIAAIAQGLQQQLTDLESLTPEQYANGWDPYIRIAGGIDGMGEIVGFKNYGPYASPKEKAIALTSYLLMLKAFEKDGEWFLSILYDNWITQIAVYLIPGDWEYITLAQLLFAERFYAMIFGGINRVRATRGNTGSVITKLLSKIPFVPQSTQQNTEEVNKGIEERKAQVEKLRKIVKELGISNTGIEEELIKLLDENPQGWMNYSPLFHEKLFYTDLVGTLNGKGRGTIFPFVGGFAGRRAFAHYRLMELFNANVQSSLQVGEKNGSKIPLTGDFEPRTWKGRQIPGTGPIIVPKWTRNPTTGKINWLPTGLGTIQNRFLGRRIDGTGTPMVHLDIRELGRFTQKEIWRVSPLSYHKASVSAENKVKDIIERFEKADTSFNTLKDFEKYRPDLAGDSGLKKAEAEIEEMRKQFLQGKMVELHPAGHPDAGKPVRDADGKLKFVASDMKASGDAIKDFEKLLSDWMKKANTGFDMDYGKALKADVIPDSDRSNPTSQEKVRLEQAKKYAAAKGDDTMRQKIDWLERTLTEQVTVTVKEGEQETTKTEYKEHMTKTEFYTRLTMILEGKAGHDTALPITNKSTFEKKKAEIASVLSGGDSTKNHILRKIMDPKTVEGLNEKSFDPKKLNIKESAEWDMLTKARLYALSQGDETLLKELNSPRAVAKGVTTISGFESRLKKLGIPANIDFQTHISSFRAQAESKIITLSDGSRFYIEDILPGDEAEIRQELINKKIAQEREIKAKTREKIDAERVLLNEILGEMNSRDGVIRKVSIKEIFIGAIKTVF